jgi:hypothetical protein
MEIDQLITVFMQNEELLESGLSQFSESERGRLLNEVGMKFFERYERTGLIDDLDRTIKMEEKAIESTPADHPDRMGWFNNLGTHCRVDSRKQGQ